MPYQVRTDLRRRSAQHVRPATKRFSARERVATLRGAEAMAQSSAARRVQCAWRSFQAARLAAAQMRGRAASCIRGAVRSFAAQAVLARWTQEEAQRRQTVLLRLWIAAVKLGDVERVRELLSKGLDLSLRNDDGCAALEHVTRAGHEAMLELLSALVAQRPRGSQGKVKTQWWLAP